MACSYSPAMPTTPRDVQNSDRQIHRTFSCKDLRVKTRMRRSHSDNHLCCSVGKTKAAMTGPKLKTSLSVGFFNLKLSDSMIPDKLKALLFDIETSKETKLEENYEESNQYDETEMDKKKKHAINWIERLMELRKNWIEKRESGEDVVEGDSGDCEEEGGCEVEYEDDEEGKDINIDTEIFSSLLRCVSWSDTKLFSQLAFLCNMAYVISDIKTEDLQRYYGLDFVTSSLEKKAEAIAIQEKIEQDSIRIPLPSPEIVQSIPESGENSNQKPRHRPTAAYEIAASAASYVQSRVWQEEDDSYSSKNYKSEIAACVAASTMTAVVAAGEKQREEAARDLQSLHSSPCEWFVCDDSSIYTRCFVIQGSDSLASWQANLFFEPAKFEGTDVLVHRGIYEAAKGIYDQFMPEIRHHLNRFGSRAKLQFTGHSLGGSLALLVNLMLLTRNEVNRSCLLPVVTFGSPYVFCGGQKILDQLGLDENHVQSVMMHRDIVPRAFSCNYPSYVAQLLKRLNSKFMFHPCLNKNKHLYSPMGKMFILQPDEKSSPPHPLLPPGNALYTLNDATSNSLKKRAIRAFLNSPHPIETLSDPTAYGSEGTILRDHDSSNYLKAVNEVIRQHRRLVVREARQQGNQLWPLLASRSPHAWSHTCSIKGGMKLNKELVSGV